MKSINLYMFEENRRERNSIAKIKKVDFDIDFRQILLKRNSEIDDMNVGNGMNKEYSIKILTKAHYNIDTFQMYKYGVSQGKGSEKYHIYDKEFIKLLKEYNWQGSVDDLETWNKCEELATEKTRIDYDCFIYVFIFDDLDEMIEFIKSYDKVDDDYNLLEDYYHTIFIENRNYKAYLKTKHWKEKRKNIIKKSKYKCQLCSSTEKLNVHHNTYENIGDEKQEDLILLCEKCHKKFHNK